MKTYKFWILNVIAIALFSCEKEYDVQYQENLMAQMPGTQLKTMEIDRNNDLYFVTYELDTSVEWPSFSSSFPVKFYLSKMNSETAAFEILDNNFIGADEILFDKNNVLWARNAKEIFRKECDTYQKVIELPADKGLFQFFAADNENNIWAGGLRTGLYKIDNELNITRYDYNNSDLPTNSMTNIHIDKQNNKWIALWNNQGVLKITNDEWIVFNTENSDITSQNIWCLVTDNNGNLWIGTGHDDENQSLMRFNGQKWETVNPKDDKNLIIRGTVRKLFSDTKRIYVVSEKFENMTFNSNKLLTYDGRNWNKVQDIPEDDVIADVKIDYSRRILWFITLNKGIFTRPL